MRTVLALAVCALFLSATASNAEFYRWVDRDGKETVTNDPDTVPAEYRGTMKPVAMGGGQVSIGDKPVTPQRTAAASGEHKDKYGHGEEYWRRKAANLRLKLRDLQGEYDLVLKQLDEQDQKPKKLGGKKKKNGSSIEKKKQKIEKDIAKARRALDTDLPEEARRADAYPGWIRE